MYQIEKVQCPACGAITEVKAWNEIDSLEHPTILREIMNYRINFAQCTGCRNLMHLERPLVFRDSGRRLYLLSRPAADIAEWEKFCDGFGAAFHHLFGRSDKCIGRITFGWNDFIEKLKIMYDDLDDVAIELIKNNLPGSCCARCEGVVDGAYYESANGEEIKFIRFCRGCRRAIELAVEREAYEELRATLTDYFGPEERRDLFFVKYGYTLEL